MCIRDRDVTYKLFKRGTEIAKKRGLILVDTKYEFGYDYKDNLCLIDEIHTPDSSRYFYEDTYEDFMSRGETPKQLSKEFFRQWLIQNDFQGEEGQRLPEISDDVVLDVSNRYIELYNKITGNNFDSSKAINSLDQIENTVINSLKLIS